MTDLYTKLLALCASTEAFYFADQNYNGKTYRIFNYRLASFSDFQKPGALECRGHTFKIGDGAPLLVSMPMEKFFNLGENPFTMDLDLSEVVGIEDKRDGSLISTVYTPDGSGVFGQYDLKSKGSLHSEQAVAARNWLALHPEFRDELEYLVADGYTVNMEWTAPDNQIVLGYTHASLRILNIRYHGDGGYMSRADADLNDEYWVDSFPTFLMDENWIADARGRQGIEGFILHFRNGLKVKLKTDWYSNLHLQKDQVNNPRRLFESVIMEQSDDLKALFLADPQAVQRITEMEDMARALYNRLHRVVDEFYNTNKELNRKDYAIAGQEALKGDGVFSLAMNLYVGRPMGLKEHLIKNYKSYGITDTTAE